MIAKRGEKDKIAKFLKKDKEISSFIFNVFWRKLENDFYNMNPRDFCLKLLKLEKIFRGARIDFIKDLKEGKFKF